MTNWKNNANQLLRGAIGIFLAYLVYNALAFEKAWPFSFFPGVSELSRALSVAANAGWSVAMFGLVLVRWQEPNTARKTLFVVATFSIIGLAAFAVLTLGHIITKLK